MPFARTLLLVSACCLIANAQPANRAVEDQVAQVVADYLKAARGTDDAKLQAFRATRMQVYSSGGTTIGNRPRGPMTRSNFLRHVRMISPDAALAIGIWHDPKAKPPSDAGIFDFVLVKENGDWKISVIREAYLPSPQTTALPPATGPIVDKEGFEQLFDGRTSRGWVTASGSPEIPSGWRIGDGSIMTLPTGERAALRTVREYTNFDLRFEWSVSEASNSGLKYRLYVLDLFRDGRAGDVVGHEYQIADDDGDSGAKVDPRQRSGALYGVTSIEKSLAKPVGEWNESRILLTSDHVEHWLNGTLAASYPIDMPFASPIALQHHASTVRFRNLRIRPLDSPSK